MKLSRWTLVLGVAMAGSGGVFAVRASSLGVEPDRVDPLIRFVGPESEPSPSNRGLGPWSEPVRVSDDGAREFRQPDLIRDTAGTLHCASAASTPIPGPSRQIYYSYSTNDGASWKSRPALSSDTTLVGNPEFSRAEGEQVWIVYEAGDGIEFVGSADGGDTFTAPVRVDHSSAPFRGRPSSVSVGNVIFVAWSELPNAHVRFNRSDDGGATWLPDDVVAFDGEASSDGVLPTLEYNPSLDRLFISWVFQESELIVIWSDDRGETWSDPVIAVSVVVNAILYGDMSIGPDGALYLVWSYYTPGPDMDVFSSRSDDHGASWSAPVQVSDPGSAGSHYESHITVGLDGILHVAYLKVAPGQETELRYVQSTDGGATWGWPHERADNDVRRVSIWVPSTFEIAAGENGGAYVAYRFSGAGQESVYAVRRDPDPADADVPSGGETLGLLLSPNPASSTLQARAPVEGIDQVVIEIHDVLGRLVLGERISAQEVRSGWYWNGRDLDGRLVVSGAYRLSITAGARTESQSFVWRR
jgi:hypothetical protein